MVKFNWGRDYWKLTIYDALPALSRLQKENIPIQNWRKRDRYEFSFSCESKYRAKIRMLFKEITLIHKHGFKPLLESLWIGKTTVVALIIALLLFGYWSRQIQGIVMTDLHQPGLQDEIETYLRDHNIARNQKIPDNSTLLKMERQLGVQFRSQLDWVEIRMQGAIIHVRLRRRQSPFIYPEIRPSLVATKAGVIQSFSLQKGIKLVKEMDYVRPGDLLAKGILITPQGEEIFVGCEGSIYAYTWYIITIEKPFQIKESNDRIEAFIMAQSAARKEIDYQLTGDDEKIINENILQIDYQPSKIRMKIHYTLLEDITR